VILRILPLVWKNLWRNRRRSILTILGVGVAIFVFAALGAVIDGITFPVREVGADRLLKVREAGRTNVLASRLPVSYEHQVEAIDGVQAATGVLSDLAVIEPEMVHIFVRGVDAERYREVRDIKVAPDVWEAFRQDQRTTIVGHRLLTRMGWEIGDEVEIAEVGLRNQIVGVIPPQGVDLENHMLVHRNYLQVLREAKGQATYVLVSPSNDHTSVEVSAAIDKDLALAPVPTQTASSAAYAEAVVEDFMGFVGYLKLMGVITMLITVVGAGNAIAMSVRERTREIGILKALGFRPGLVLVAILVESTGLSALGGILGLVAAKLIVGSESANLSGLILSPTTVVVAASLSILTGLLGGLLPGVAAARLKTVDALRSIG
jgi:putative ABC transport system permease protein